jgi:hypothetical protein
VFLSCVVHIPGINKPLAAIYKFPQNPNIERNAQFDMHSANFQTDTVFDDNHILTSATNAPFTDITDIISGANNITDDDQQTTISDSFVRTSNRLSIARGHDIFP